MNEHRVIQLSARTRVGRLARTVGVLKRTGWPLPTGQTTGGDGTHGGCGNEGFSTLGGESVSMGQMAARRKGTLD